MLVWPRADLRESTVQQAVKEMAAALDFYAYGKWNVDYPGGIDTGNNGLDFGYQAIRTLKNRHVRRVLEAIGGEDTRDV